MLSVPNAGVYYQGPISKIRCTPIEITETDIYTYLIMLIACVIVGTITLLYQSFGRSKRGFTEN